MRHPMEGELLSAGLLEKIYEQYITNPQDIDPQWVAYFQSLEFPLKEAVSSESEEVRRHGHLDARINPLKEEKPREEQEGLKKIYSGRIGFEYLHIHDPALKEWLQNKIENQFFRQELSGNVQQRILEYLNQSELFETFLHTKYVGQKRFSLEGVETLIPMLALVIETGALEGVLEFVIGMSHRGRLNVLTHILNKSYHEIFSEFEEKSIPMAFEGMGDVKYHKGYVGENVKTYHGKKIKVTLCPNPSHLESVNCVAEGQTRAKQFAAKDKDRKKIIPILIHGDAAIAGQGVVYETFQLARLPGYQTGGTLHFVINNQIGFTTIPRDLRSTYYCTDIAKSFDCPIFHVNAEDPEGCVHAALLAYEIRQKFSCDTVIDLNGYRKYGHNEGDEPSFTQPIEYKIIKAKQPIRELYRDQLLSKKILEESVIVQLEEQFKKGLQEAHAQFHTQKVKSAGKEKKIGAPSEIKLDKARLIQLAEAFCHVPDGFTPHPKLAHLLRERLARVQEGQAIDWSLAEHLAFASILDENLPIRLSGQDSCRGTFSQRHAVWVDQETEKEYFPMAHLRDGQGFFEAINSPLSEMGVLGFEYGYSVSLSKGLTIWEAQFGDFGNGAQIIIDQYIASGEQKWGQRSGLVLFLPHGYEGQGPEHSSGRIERFLSLAGHENMIIANPTAPAQFFHLLRRQAHAEEPKPLIIFTPKGLLRHPACVSPLHDLAQGEFHPFLEEASFRKVKRLIFCSGRIYYDLMAKGREDLAIIRLEQLYPLDLQVLKQIAEKYQAKDWMWVQEEPQNMGAWNFLFPLLLEILPEGVSLKYAGRMRSATPATGSHLQHEKEHELILKQVFEDGN